MDVKYCNTFLEINLNNIVQNYQTVLKQLAQNVNHATVLKANAYGLGIKEISKVLSNAGCKNFFMSNLDEAILLRSNIEDSIYFFNGIDKLDAAEACLEYNVMPVLNSLEQIEVWQRLAKSKGQKLKAIIHIDTGMARLGLSHKDVINIVDKNHLTENIDIIYIMSQLACAEQYQHDKNIVQLNSIKQYASMFPGVMVSLANSAAIFLGTEYHFDLVRFGCALYGINPTSHLPNPLLTVVKLKAYVLQRRVLEKDQHVSYGTRHYAKSGDKLLTIEFGYVDGYVRTLSNHGKCYVEGYLLPIIGLISMDCAIIDATELPDSLFYQVKYVEVLGEHVCIDDMAKYANNIGYELMITRLGNRFKRVYIND